MITDDLNMAPSTKRYTAEPAAVLAVAAGADLLIVGNKGRPDPMAADRIIDAIAKAVADGRIPAEQVRRAYDLIVLAKLRLRERSASLAD